MHFENSPLTEEIIVTMKNSNVWNPNCPIPIDRLKLLQIPHYNFEGEIKEGQLVVFDVVSYEVIQIFQELFELKFPIDKMHLIDKYNGDDEASMADNNSSSFNFRKIAGSSKLSLHGLGMAIDINPVQNPCLALDKENYTIGLSPKAGIDYLNRNNQRAGMVEKIVDIFHNHGFQSWGGNWNNPIDYQHFQVNREIAEQISLLNFKDGLKIFMTQIKT